MITTVWCVWDEKVLARQLMRNVRCLMTYLAEDRFPRRRSNVNSIGSRTRITSGSRLRFRGVAVTLLLGKEPLKLRAEFLGGRHVLRLVGEQAAAVAGGERVILLL
jgi:hypothetical protein